MAAEIETPSVPSRLYRYRPLDSDINSDIVKQEIDALQRNYIWCGNFNALNDAMEGLVRPSSLLSDDEELYEKYDDKLFQSMGKLGVASFSESHKNDTMWAHYANKFNGICISYKFRTLMKCLSKGSSFVRMNYSDQAPLLMAKTTDFTKAAKTTLSTKNPRWLSEREWRLFSNKQGRVTYRYPAAISSVYIGVKVDSSVALHIRRVIDELDADIKAYRMKIDGYNIQFRLARPEFIRRKTF
ncbi:DUF2971 domain-containing protein [uncultured Aureimonas sp.]|uniref:DUF2971 domain-containing protein n=1 Tax=uncultured Aureimonas sp. TaxID=1604662 RepID=UPI0025E05833|nr:DUF2971 domain-containing protein [uncultured Aureimonas sp.]